MSSWFSAHTHSHFSALDGMARVPDIVAKAAQMGQPAVGLTDHGVMAGAVQLYTSAKKHGIAPFVGVEAYLLDPNATLDDKKPQRYHVGLLSLNLAGYQGLIGLVNASHTRPRFSRFPRITLADLIDLAEDHAEDIALTTGCYFGLVQQRLVHESDTHALNTVRTYASLFPHTFVEVQHHNICHDQESEEQPLDDDDIVGALVDIADQLGLPVLATQDSHYLDQNDKAAHSLMKRMTYGGVEDEFPGDAFHIASAEWVAEHYDDDTWAKVEEGSEHLLDLHALSIPALDTFTAHVPEIVKRPERVIARLCIEALDDYEPAHRKRKKYEERLQYELDIINDLGMAGYFMIVRNYVEWCNDKGICIEARGSANGSLVCFLLGITQVDPIKWKLLFDRFLSRDRIKPPDIDMDVEDVARGRLMGYLHRTFDTLQIGNWSGLGIRDDGGGSVLQTYKTYLARQTDDKEERALIYKTIESVDDVQRIDKRDHRGLVRLGKMNVYRSYGVHASGLLLSGSDQRIDDYVPRMLVASSDTHVSQFAQEDVEQLGYLKLDVLGQVVLTVMRTCQELIGRDDPTDFSWIPENDAAACKILREGRTENGIFHFEGYALRDDQRVLTPTGWVPISAMHAGCPVVDPDGGVCYVDGVYPQGVREMNLVTLHDGTEVVATDDHLWNYRLNNGRVLTGTTADLKRLLSDTTYQPKLVDFTPSDLGKQGAVLPVDPYVLGLLIGDGCLTNPSVVRYSSGDIETVNAIANKSGLVAHKDTGYSWWFSPSVKRANNNLLDGLKRLGLMGKGARDKRVPKEYLWAPVDVRLEVLRGLMDSDGCAKANGSMAYTTISDGLADDVEFLVRSLNGKCKRTVNETRQEGRIVILDSIRFARPTVPFRLARKAARVRSTNRHRGWGIKSIVRIDEAPATCIAVSSKSQCFITEGFTVTHNTKAKGGRQMGIRSTMDAVLATGLFMPGAMDTGQTDLYLHRRKDREAREKVTYIHPIFEAALKDTYGAVVFQEQVINIMRGLGMSVEGINTFFKVVKSSGAGAVAANNKRIAQVRDEFDDLCRQAGISESDIDRAWESTAGFVAYGFNRAHATGYGLRSYRCSYLKAHYPLEFMAALLQANAGRDKEILYVREARRIGIRILSPDVNISTVSWTLDRKAKAIRKGLLSIKGVGMAAAESLVDNAPYESIQDLIDRTDSRAVTGGKQYAKDGTLNGVLAKLLDANALRSIHDG